jgi:hypothetical protein
VDISKIYVDTLSLCDLESLSNAVTWEIEKRNKVRAKIMPKHIPQPDVWRVQAGAGVP